VLLFFFSMSTSNGGAQDPAIPVASSGNVVKGSAMELFAPDPNAVGESVSLFAINTIILLENMSRCC
jgi:hypothetical protein